jgi:hypothetical protein
MHHDLDRTLLETEYPAAFEPPDEADSDGALSPAEELELASELLEVNSDEELEQFIGDLIGRAVHAVSNFARSSTGRSLGHMLVSAFKNIEPYASKALDTWIASRGQGNGGGAEAVEGAEGQLPADIGRLLGLDLEGLSPEDREFEVSRQLVRLAASAAQQASLAPQQADPDAVARQAIMAAASDYAPGLLDQRNGSPSPASALSSSARSGSARSGRWVRRGHTITLYGIYGPAAKSAAIEGGQAS